MMKKSSIIVLSITATLALTIVILGVIGIAKSVPKVKDYKEIYSFCDSDGEKNIVVSYAELKNSLSQYRVKITATNNGFSDKETFDTNVIHTFSAHWIDENIAVICETNEGNSNANYLVDFSKKVSVKSNDKSVKSNFYDITSRSGFTTIFSNDEQRNPFTHETKEKVLYIFSINDNDNYFSFQQEDYEEYMKYNTHSKATVGFRQNGKEIFTGEMEIYDDELAVITIDKKYADKIN